MVSLIEAYEAEHFGSVDRVAAAQVSSPIASKRHFSPTFQIKSNIATIAGSQLLAPHKWYPQSRKD
ncbi:hypothetical protein D3C81_455180 [compost metagenome]